MSEDKKVWIQKRKLCILSAHDHWHLWLTIDHSEHELIQIACDTEIYEFLKVLQSDFISLDSSICDSIIEPEPKLLDWWNKVTNSVESISQSLVATVSSQ